MTQDEIIRMAREAGCYEKYEVCYFVREDLERFYLLAWAAGAAHEREKQAEQEPVGIVHDAYDTQGIEWKCKDPLPTGTPLYAAPVRTKDLSDDEIQKIWEETISDYKFARAVIAADREKNNA